MLLLVGAAAAVLLISCANVAHLLTGEDDVARGGADAAGGARRDGGASAAPKPHGESAAGPRRRRAGRTRRCRPGRGARSELAGRPAASPRYRAWTPPRSATRCCARLSCAQWRQPRRRFVPGAPAWARRSKAHGRRRRRAPLFSAAPPSSCKSRCRLSCWWARCSCCEASTTCSRLMPDLRQPTSSSRPCRCLASDASPAGGSSPGRVVEGFEAIVSQVSQMWGVEAAGLVNHLPLSNDGSGTRFTLERRVTRPEDVPTASYRVVSPTYFATVRARLAPWAVLQRLRSAGQPASIHHQRDDGETILAGSGSRRHPHPTGRNGFDRCRRRRSWVWSRI